MSEASRRKKDSEARGPHELSDANRGEAVLLAQRLLQPVERLAVTTGAGSEGHIYFRTDPYPVAALSRKSAPIAVNRIAIERSISAGETLPCSRAPIWPPATAPGTV